MMRSIVKKFMVIFLLALSLVNIGIANGEQELLTLSKTMQQWEHDLQKSNQQSIAKNNAVKQQSRVK